MAGSKKTEETERTAKRVETEREISRVIKNLDPSAAAVKLDELSGVWRLMERDASFETQTMHMFRTFGLDYDDNMLDDLDADRGSFGLRELDDRINERELEAIGLYHRMHELGMFPEKNDEDPSKRETLRKIVKVLEMVFYAKRVVLSAFQAKLAVHQLHVEDGVLDLDQDLDVRLGSWALRFRFIDGETTGFQNLLLFLLDAAMEKKYRKADGWLYEPVVINGRDMHSWRPVCEIKDFVYSMLRKETCWDQWKNATQNMKNVASAIEYLTNCHDHQLPQLVKQRGVYSFCNGVYVAERDHFYDFSSDQAPLSDKIVSCKFVDVPFDATERASWRDIPTPHLDSIMIYQGWPDDVRNWLYVFLGRMLYSLNAHDSWQVIPFFKGVGSSGKSTIILKVCKNFFDAVDVGILSNNIERKFGISAFYDKYLFLAPEIRNDLAMEQAEFQSIVSGEDVQVNVKHKKAFCVEWTVPGALAGNEVPSWADSGGSIQRRIVLFDFARPVRNGDMKLGDKLAAELPNILRKCNKAYLEKAAKYSEVNIWSVLPKYFVTTRDSLAQSTNSIEGFMATPDVRVGEDRWCPFDDFKSALKEYEIKNSIPSKRYTSDFFVGPFEKLGLKMCRETRAYRGGPPRFGDYVIGVDIDVHAADNVLG